MLSLIRDKLKQNASGQSGIRPSRRINALLFPDVSLNPWLSTLLTLLLLLVFTWAIRSLRLMTHDQRPYTTLYLIPVAFAGAFMGLRGGLAATLAALVIARIFLFNTQHGYSHFPNLADGVEFMALAMGTVFIAGITGRLHNVIRDLHLLHSRLLHSEERRLAFSREVLYAVTGGRLLLCDAAELRSMVSGKEAMNFALKQPADVSAMRAVLKEIAHGINLGARQEDLFICATEAAANAVKHGNGGTAQAWMQDEEISLVISDHGPGISPANLARATLERGFSTQISLGMGFVMMLESVDALVLSTSEKGTTVLMRVSKRPRISMEENLLSRFSMEASI